jgi:hypothetical protein
MRSAARFLSHHKRQKKRDRRAMRIATYNKKIARRTIKNSRVPPSSTGKRNCAQPRFKLKKRKNLKKRLAFSSDVWYTKRMAVE